MECSLSTGPHCIVRWISWHPLLVKIAHTGTLQDTQTMLAI
jgi:hypothetical protein